MIYIDSNIFIYPVIYGEKNKKASSAKKVLFDIAERKIEACTSTLTWDELVWVINKTLGKKIADMEGEKFLRFPNLKMVDVDLGVIKEAQKILNKYDIVPRDAIHAGCAIKNGAKKIITFDKDFDKVSGLKRIKPT